MSAGVISASSFAGQQVPETRGPRLVRSRQAVLRRRTACSAGTEKIVELYTVAVTTAGTPSPVGPAGAPSITTPSLPSVPISGRSAAALVDSAVASTIDLIKAAGSLAKSGVDAAGVGAEYAKDAYSRVSPVLTDAANTAAPYVKTAAKTANDVAQPALKAVQPVLQGAVGEVDTFLRQQGLNSQAVVSTAQDAQTKAQGALNTASPQVNSVLYTLTHTSPTLLAEYSLGLVALYYLGPSFFKVLFGSLRGYRGNISPASALDTVSREGNAVIIDIRTDREKENGGVPDLPYGNRLIDCEYASIADRRLRGQLKNVKDIERQVTVLEIASLKRIGKGSKVLLLDNNGGTAKQIAKGLSGRGFRNVFVIDGGYSGWTSQKLQTKLSSTVSATEILSPFFGGTQRQTTSSRRALPSGR